MLRSAERILGVFDTTTRTSALPSLLGVRPFSKCRPVATANGVLRLEAPDAAARLFEAEGVRIFRGHSVGRCVAVEGRYRRNNGAWVEIETLVFEYADADALARRAMPTRRLSTVTRADGSTLTSTVVRTACPEQDEERLVRQTCLRGVDRSRVEEEESILRVQDRSRYDLLRHEFDPAKNAKKSLEYRYPWLPHAFYERVYAKLVDFAMSTDAWATAV